MIWSGFVLKRKVGEHSDCQAIWQCSMMTAPHQPLEPPKVQRLHSIIENDRKHKSEASIERDFWGDPVNSLGIVQIGFLTPCRKRKPKTNLSGSNLFVIN